MKQAQMLLLATVSSSAAALFFLATRTDAGCRPAESNATASQHLDQDQQQAQLPVAISDSWAVDDDALETAILQPAAMDRKGERSAWWTGLSLAQKLDKRSGDTTFVREKLQHVRMEPEDEMLRLNLEPIIKSAVQRHADAAINGADTTFECGTTICVLRGLPVSRGVAMDIFPQILLLVQENEPTANLLVSGTPMHGEGQTLLFFYTPDYVVTPPER